MIAPRLDEIDRDLLELLQRNSGRTLHDIGDEVGLSPSAVQRRIARYRTAGVITKNVAVLDPELVGPAVLAVVLVTLVHETIELHRAFADRVSACEHVQQCYSVAGPWDYVVVLVAGSTKACRQLGDQLFQADENVRRYEILIVFDVVKTGVTIPLSREVTSGDAR